MIQPSLLLKRKTTCHVAKILTLTFIKKKTYNNLPRSKSLIHLTILDLSPIHFFDISLVPHRKASLPLPLPPPPPPPPPLPPPPFSCSVRIFNPSPVSLSVFLLPGFYFPLAFHISVYREHSSFFHKIHRNFSSDFSKDKHTISNHIFRS